MERHLSRLAMPKSWKIKRKGIKWVTRPHPGAHSLKLGLSLNVFLRDLLTLAKTTREVKSILNKQEVFVDGKRRKDHKYIVGLMDVVTLPKINKSYRILLNEKGYIRAVAIKKDEAGIKPCKITGKTVVRKGKMQLNLFDGKCLLVDKNELNVGDSVVIEIPSQKIKERLPFAKGSTIYLIGGKHVGNVGVVEEIMNRRIVYKRDQDRFETLKRYAFVIGKGKPVIELP